MVYRNKTISLVIPAYNEERLIIPTLKGVPKYIDIVYVVDDSSSDSTADLVEEYHNKHDGRVKLIKHIKNQGPGGAIISGYLRSLEANIDIAAVCGADHQFDLSELPKLFDPIIENQADYVKGNRFLVDAKHVMPNKRYLGNILLSFLTRLASGRHNIFDTQDGFTAISQDVLKIVNWDLFWKSYGYVSDFIIKIATYGFRIKDIPRRSIYIDGERQSQINIKRYIFLNFPMIIKGWIWRLLNKMKYNKIRIQKLKEIH